MNIVEAFKELFIEILVRYSSHVTSVVIKCSRSKLFLFLGFPPSFSYVRSLEELHLIAQT